MKCTTCPRTSGRCLGERLTHLCHRPDYRDYLAGYDDGAKPVPHYPSPLRMAANLVTATATHVADGLRTAPPEEQARRLTLCQACPQYDAPADRCRRCGCTGLKREWASSACPEGTWGPIPD